MIRTNKVAALTLAGLTLFSSMLVTTAFAGPDQKKKKPSKPAKKTDNKAAVTAGKKVFDANCLGCHAVGGKGGTNGPDLSKVAADSKHTPKWLEEKVVNPKASNPDSTMPSYEESIKGKDLKNLVAYLSTLKK